MSNILHRVGIAAEPARVFEALRSRTGGPPRHTVMPPRAERSNSAKSTRSGPRRSELGGVALFRSGGRLGRHGDRLPPRMARGSDLCAVQPRRLARAKREFMHHCSTKWATFLLSLKDLVENGESRPEPRDTKIAVNA